MCIQASCQSPKTITDGQLKALRNPKQQPPKLWWHNVCVLDGIKVNMNQLCVMDNIAIIFYA